MAIQTVRNLTRTAVVIDVAGHVVGGGQAYLYDDEEISPADFAIIQKHINAGRLVLLTGGVTVPPPANPGAVLVAVELVNGTLVFTDSTGGTSTVALPSGGGGAVDLTPYARTAYVTTSLSGKVDKTSYAADLNLKADKSALGVFVKTIGGVGPDGQGNVAATTPSVDDVPGLSSELSGKATVDALQAALARIAALEGAVPRAAGPVTALAYTLTDNTANLSWTAPADPGTRPITGYKITPAGGSTQTVTSRAATVSGLARGATTVVTVVAVTAVGDGASATVSIAVPAAATAVPGAPTSLSVSVTGQTATLTYAAPSSNGGSPITGYYPSRNGVDAAGAGPYRASTPLGAGVLTATFPNLVPGNTYQFGVEAANVNGTGPIATISFTIPGGNTVSYPKDRLSHPYWTTALHPNAPLASTSDDWSARVKAQFDARPSGTTPSISVVPPYNTKVETDKYAIPIYRLPAGTPRVPVYSLNKKYYTDPDTGATINLQDILDEGVPLPEPSTPGLGGTIPPSGSDGSCIFIDTGTYEEWELWRVTKAADGSAAKLAGYDWQCTQGAKMNDYRFHPGYWSGSVAGNVPKGGDFGVSASGFSYLGPILTGEDWQADVIKHPLTMALYITGGNRNLGEPDRVLPATRSDRFNFSPTSNTVAENFRVPEGARFRLNPVKWTDAAIDAYAAQKGQAVNDGAGSTPSVLKKILRCARDYGIIVGDSASNIIGFSAEHDKTYGTIYNPYSTAQRPNWGDFGQALPWGDLQQVQIPTVQFHTPGNGPTSMQPPAYDFSLNPGTLGADAIPVDISQVNVTSIGSNYGTRGYGMTLSLVDGKLRTTYATATNSNILDPGVAVASVAVTAGKTYRMSVDVTRLVGTSALQPVISWRGSNGAQVGSSAGANTGIKVGSTATLTVDGVAPANAVTAFVYVHQATVAATNGDSYDTDNWHLYEVLLSNGDDEAEVPTTPGQPSVPAWSYGLQDQSGAYIRKDAYLPTMPTGATRTHIGPDISSSGHGWNYNTGGGSFTGVDTSNYVRGSSSMRVTTNGTGSTSVIQRAQTATDISKGRVVRVLLYVSDYTVLDSIGFHFASNGSSTMTDSVIRSLDNRFFRTGWQTITMSVSEMAVSSGSFDATKLNYVKLNVRDKGTSGSPKPVTVNFGGIWVEDTAPVTKGAVVFTFDDGGQSHYTQALPIMRDEYGFPGTAYVMPGDFGVDPSRMTGTQVKALRDAGWTVGAHAWSGATHTNMSATQLATNIAQTKAWLNSNLGSSDHFAYWDGLDYQNGDIRDVIASNFRTGRANKGSQASLESARPGMPLGMRSWLTGSDSYGWTPGTSPVWPGTSTANTAADWLNRSLNGNGLAIFTFHTIGPNGLDLNVFRSYLNHAKAGVDAGVLEVLNMEQAAARVGL